MRVTEQHEPAGSDAYKRGALTVEVDPARRARLPVDDAAKVYSLPSLEAKHLTRGGQGSGAQGKSQFSSALLLWPSAWRRWKARVGKAAFGLRGVALQYGTLEKYLTATCCTSPDFTWQALDQYTFSTKKIFGQAPSDAAIVCALKNARRVCTYQTR